MLQKNENLVVLPKIGSICKFSLMPGFDMLDGVYKVLSIMDFDDALLNNVDFNKSLYAPAGLSKEDYANDARSFKEHDVVKVQDVTDPKRIFYFPQAILKFVPDPTVKKYPLMVYGARIGYFKDEPQARTIKPDLDQLVYSVNGDPGSTWWFSSEEDAIYLTDKEYEESISQPRNKAIYELQPLNYKVIELRRQITSLKSNNAALKQKLESILPLFNESKAAEKIKILEEKIASLQEKKGG